MRVLIAGGTVVTDGTAARRDLLLDGGRIAAILVPGEGPADAPRHDAARRLVLPGLVNAHTHGHANLMKGVADRWLLESSLTNGPWMGGERDAATIHLSALLGATEMLEAGVTAAYDLFYEFPVPTPAGLLAAARGYAEAGLRAVIAPMVADLSLFAAIPGLADALPDDLRSRVTAQRPASTDGLVAALREVIAASSDLPEGIVLALAPTIPHHCTPGFLRNCRDLADRHGLRLHTHVAESRLQAVVARRLWGHGQVFELDRAGLLGPDLTLAHGVWLDEAELDRVAARGASVAHMPASNLRLGSGIAPVRAMLSRGIPVGLGTDGCNSADSLNVFEAARLAANLSRARDVPRDGWLGAAEALRLATEGGAAVLDLGTGRIAPGMPADLILLDLDHRGFVPLNDPVVQAVTCNVAGAVREVFVGGRQVVAEGRCVSPAAYDLPARAEAALDALRARTAPARDLAARLEPHVVAFAEREGRGELPVTSKVPG